MSLKPKHQLLKLEQIELNKQYAITLNPEIKSRRTEPYRYCSAVYDELKQYESMDFELYPESSPSGKIHFHGYVKIKDYIRYIKDISLIIDVYTVCIKELMDDLEPSIVEEYEGEWKSWKDYCTKQSKIFEQVFVNTPLGYPMVVLTGNKLPVPPTAGASSKSAKQAVAKRA